MGVRPLNGAAREGVFFCALPIRTKNIDRRAVELQHRAQKKNPGGAGVRDRDMSEGGLLRQREAEADAIVSIRGRVGVVRDERRIDLEIVVGSNGDGTAEGIVGREL